jgi:uncharacterized protein (DUF1499 family)
MNAHPHATGPASGAASGLAPQLFLRLGRLLVTAGLWLLAVAAPLALQPAAAAAALFHLVGPVPVELGLHDGRLSACTAPSHCDRQDWPLADPLGSLRQLVPVLEATPGIAVERFEEEPEAAYLHATAESRLFGFIDDLELAADARSGVLQVRSASRLGDSDLGVNRARLESLKQALDAGISPAAAG